MQGSMTPREQAVLLMSLLLLPNLLLSSLRWTPGTFPRYSSVDFALQLKVKIARQQAAKEQKLRRKNLTKYIPNAAAAVFKVLQSMADTPAVGQKRRRLEAEDDILESVKRGETVEATLAQKLTEYVERIDTDMVQDLNISCCVCFFDATFYVYLAQKLTECAERTDANMVQPELHSICCLCIYTNFICLPLQCSSLNMYSVEAYPYTLHTDLITVLEAVCRMHCTVAAIQMTMLAAVFWHEAQAGNQAVLYDSDMSFLLREPLYLADCVCCHSTRVPLLFLLPIVHINGHCVFGAGHKDRQGQNQLSHHQYNDQILSELCSGQTYSVCVSCFPAASAEELLCMWQALEYQMQQGVAEAARHDLYIAPLSAQHEYGPELHSNVCVLKLLQPV